MYNVWTVYKLIIIITFNELQNPLTLDTAVNVEQEMSGNCSHSRQW